MILFRLNLNSLNIIGLEVFYQFLLDLINYVTRARRHFLPRYSNRTFRLCLSLFMNPNRGLRIHAHATCRGKRRRKCASEGKRNMDSGRAVGGGRREKTRRRSSCRAKGRKSLQPVSKRFVPGQSIKNVSRAEIIKVRISSRRQGTMRDEERRCMMQGDQ